MLSCWTESNAHFKLKYIISLLLPSSKHITDNYDRGSFLSETMLTQALQLNKNVKDKSKKIYISTSQVSCKKVLTEFFKQKNIYQHNVTVNLTDTKWKKKSLNQVLKLDTCDKSIHWLQLKELGIMLCSFFSADFPWITATSSHGDIEIFATILKRTST